MKRLLVVTALLLASLTTTGRAEADSIPYGCQGYRLSSAPGGSGLCNNGRKYYASVWCYKANGQPGRRTNGSVETWATSTAICSGTYPRLGSFSMRQL